MNANLLDVKHVKKNAIINLASQLIMAVVMFGLAKVILMYYGDVMNGLVRSIVMLTSYFSLVDAGIASIITQRLYKLVIKNDVKGINNLMSISKKIFFAVTIMFIVLCTTTSMIYPFAIESNNQNIIDFPFVMTLILVLSLKAIPNYLWNIHYDTLLTTMQKGYIFKILNTFISVFFYALAALIIYLTRPELTMVTKGSHKIYIIKSGFEDHKWWIIVSQLVVSAYVFILSIALKIYSHKKMPWLKFSKVKWSETKFVWKNAKYTLASAVSWLIVFSTDEIVLTIYSYKIGANESLYLVSILSMYGMIIFMGRTLLENFYSAAVPYIGLSTEGEKNMDLNKFKLFSFGVISISLVSAISLMLFSPMFIQTFFNSHKGSNYFKMEISGLLAINVFLHLVSIPYNTLFKTRGNFKGLLIPNILEAIGNFGGSIICVWFFGINGILIVTLIVMLLRYVDFTIRGRRYVEGGHKVHNISLISVFVSVGIMLALIFTVLNKWQIFDHSYLISAAYASVVVIPTGIILLVILFFIKKWAERMNKIKQQTTLK